MKIIIRLFFAAAISALFLSSSNSSAAQVNGSLTNSVGTLSNNSQNVTPQMLNAVKQLTPSQQEAIKQQIQAGGITPSVIEKAKTEIRTNKGENLWNKTASQQNRAGESAENKKIANINSIYQRIIHIRSGALKVNEKLKPFGYKLF